MAGSRKLTIIKFYNRVFIDVPHFIELIQFKMNFIFKVVVEIQ